MLSSIDQQLLQRFKNKHKLADQRNVMTLLAIQGALLVVLLAFLLILAFSVQDPRHLLYIPLIHTLLGVLLIALIIIAPTPSFRCS